MKIKISKNAEKHLDSIFDFIFKENEKAAINTYNTILDEIELLIKYPQMAAKESLLEDSSHTYSSLVVMRRYKVVYFIGDETVHISAIWDCRRNPDLLIKNFE